MGSINAKERTGTLFFDFRFRGKRCKEYTKLKDSPANRKKLKKILERIDAEIIIGSFNYGEYFPNSRRAADFARDLERVEVTQSGLPSCGEFAETWFSQMQVEWRDSYADTVRITLDKYLIPEFEGVRQANPFKLRTSGPCLQAAALVHSIKVSSLWPNGVQ